MTQPIPPIAHFIWFGRELLWVHRLAIQSAAERGGFKRVVLHHADDLSGSPQWEALQAIDGVETRPVVPEALLERAGGGALVEVFRELTELAGKANMIRAALLYLEGGTYLDADTVTLRRFDELLAPGGVFCGAEYLIKPHTAQVSRSVTLRMKNLVRRMARSSCRELPGGWRLFRYIERFYPTAVNNAVLGGAPGDPFLRELLDAMIAIPSENRRVRYALGTHLLQQVVARHGGEGLRVLPPRVFYPLGPEISLHWFRRVSHPLLEQVLFPDTVLVHWYASVRTREIAPMITPAYVRNHAESELFSALALPFVRE